MENMTYNYMGCSCEDIAVDPFKSSMHCLDVVNVRDHCVVNYSRMVYVESKITYQGIFQ